ncbi:MAG: DUF1329 domain-containing protein [Inquilinus sp.]|nr:DUF1329 domain-containing protein [Inquilinus sp.]
MKNFTGALLAGAFAVLAAMPAKAQDPSQLGSTLTPFGAIRAGNADGTIPAWTGGITSPPAGYSIGDHHPDPFAGDRVQFSITGANADAYADKLTPGHLATLRQYPSFAMNVYPTRRSASAPQRIYDATIANARSAQLVADGNGVDGASVGIPFPIPNNGLEAIWNHLLRFRGETVFRQYGQANPTAGGAYTMVRIDEKLLFRYARGEPGNTSVLFLQEVVGPARLAGEILLVHETINQITEPRQAWTYNPGQRRVRRAPNIAYDNPGTAADGLRTSDNLDIFNGAPDRYTWDLVGRRELYVPYNAYKLHSNALSYDDIIRPNHLNPEHLRYELHRVWVVDARLKDGTSHIYARRTFYLDEDSWQIVAVDHYDSRGQLWRLGEAHGINYYEVPTFWTTLDTIYDLQAGRYTANGFDNEQAMYDFSVELDDGDFTPNALRRAGRR